MIFSSEQCGWHGCPKPLGHINDPEDEWHIAPGAAVQQSALEALLVECGCSHVKAQHPDGDDGVCTAGNPRDHESPEWKVCYCNEFDSERDDSWRWQRFALTETALKEASHD